VYLKKENTSSPQTGLICEIRINIPGATLFAGSNSASLEASIAKATGDVKSQLQRKKEKMQMQILYLLKERQMIGSKKVQIPLSPHIKLQFRL
jgi:ribosome-associated translation inhibitor RaiA